MMDQQYIIFRLHNAFPKSVRPSTTYRQHPCQASENDDRAPSAVICNILFVYFYLSPSRIFDFPVIHGRAYQKSCIVGRPTSYMILSNPDSKFIPLEAHTISVMSGHTYFLASQACLIVFVALFLLLNLAFEHGVCAMDCFARHGEGMVFLGLGKGVLVGVAFCAFEVGEEDENWNRTGSRAEENIYGL
jgi:hypothetical protein